jgi:hypothetical protein
MAIRLGGAALLLGLLVWLTTLYFCSRRCPSVVLFVLSCLLGIAGGAAWVVGGDEAGGSVLFVVSVVGAVAGGVGGAVLTGIDCVREEAWRREPARPAVRPDAALVRDLARRIRDGTAPPVGDCPFCGTRVCFRADLSCPNCERRLDET